MKFQNFSAGVLALAMLLCPALAADDDALARMALCKDSWVDWSKSDPAKMKAFADGFRAQFTPHDNDPFALPKGNISVMGFHVSQGFPESVGMGVGFSLTLDAMFDDARKAVEKALGKPLGKCESSDGMKSCELEIAPQRTVTLMAEDKPGAKETLVGCYYFYEK
jgi:hypothetical protein